MEGRETAWGRAPVFWFTSPKSHKSWDPARRNLRIQLMTPLGAAGPTFLSRHLLPPRLSMSSQGWRQGQGLNLGTWDGLRESASSCLDAAPDTCSCIAPERCGNARLGRLGNRWHPLEVQAGHASSESGPSLSSACRLDCCQQHRGVCRGLEGSGRSWRWGC